MKMPAVQAAAADQKSMMPTETIRPEARHVGSSATNVQRRMMTSRIQ